MTTEEIKTELARQERALKNKRLIGLGFKEKIEAKISVLKKQLSEIESKKELKSLKISKAKVDSLAKKVEKIKQMSYKKPIKKLTTGLFELLFNKDFYLDSIRIDNITKTLNYFEKPHLYSASIKLIATENYDDGNMDSVSIVIEKNRILIEETYRVEGERGTSFSEKFYILDDHSDKSYEYERLIEDANRCISMFSGYSLNRLAMSLNIIKRGKKIIKRKIKTNNNK